MKGLSLRNWEMPIIHGGTLSISYGKNSLACLGACEHLGWKINRIVHAELWATESIPAELPPMIEFKAKVDKFIEARYGIKVEHLCARYKDGSKVTYEREFYRVITKGGREGNIVGFPFQRGAWCNSKLKMRAINQCKARGIEFIGIATDEHKRLRRISGNLFSPLNEVGWEDDFCGLWCQYSGLLSPCYDEGCRNGCWFCHNQRTEQLRLLRKNYPEYWELLLKWDKDSPVSFKPDGKTVHDYEKRFQYEEEGMVPTDGKFRWDMLERPLQYSLWRFAV